MIILEGPDGAGKTRLALRLADELKAPIAPKVVSADMSSEVDLAAHVWSEIDSWPKRVIYDRFSLYSEFIYGPIFGRGVRDAFADWQSLQIMYTQMRRHRPTVIFCLPPLIEVLANVMNEETDNEAVRERIESVYWQYFALSASMGRSLVWDYTKPHYYNTMIQQLKNEQWRSNALEY